MSIRHISPTLRIGQRTTITREIQLVEADHGSDPLDLSGAESVTITLEHYEYGHTAVENGACTIVNPSEGIVSYTFDQRDTSLHGRYLVQFEVDYGAQTELVPPNSEDWVLDIGRRQSKYQPLDVPRITADEGVLGHMQADTVDIGSATIEEFANDPNISSLSIDTLNLTAFDGGVVGARGPLTRLDGPDLQINANGELEWVDPNTGGFVDGSDHDHSVTGSGGDTLRPATLGSKIHFATPGDTQSVRDALARANADGSAVFVPPGTYSMTGDWFTIREGVTFWASPQATFVRDDSTLDTMLANGDTGDAPTGYNGESNITVVGGQWDAQHSLHGTTCTPLAFGYAENITVRDVEVRDVGSDWHHGEFNGVKNGLLENSHLHTQSPTQSTGREMWQIDRTSANAFPWFGSDDGTHAREITIRDCTFEDGGGCAIGSHSVDAGELYEDITIENCIFRGFDGHAISTLCWSDVEITNCRWEDNWRALTIDNTTAGAGKFRVDGGIIEARPATSEPAIYFGQDEAYDAIKISNLTMKNGGGAAIKSWADGVDRYTDITIEGCSFIGFASAAIDAHDWTRAEIIDCRWEDNDKAVVVTDSGVRGESFKIRGGTIIGRPADTVANRGIHFELSGGTGGYNDVTIADIDLYDIGRHGIGLDHMGGTGITIDSVTVRRAGNTGIWIGFGGAEDVRVSNCHLVDTGGNSTVQRGLRLSGDTAAATNVIITGNHFDYVTQHASGATGLFTDNIVTNTVTIADTVEVYNNIIGGVFVASGTA